MSNETNNKTRQGRRQAREKSKKTNTNKKGLWKKILIALVALGAVAVIAGGITIFAIIQGAPPLDEERLMLTQGSQFYDQDDVFVSQLDSTERRQNVRIQEVPQVVEDAFIAVEDIRFRDHFGIDIRRLFGAVRANIQSGFGAEGASTITQQLVKNLFLNDQKQLTRKIQEQYLAIKLEQQYSKDQILEMYLNQIYLGSGVYGVELASRTYFNKSVGDLSLTDAALLAGIPRRPSFYDPTKNPEAAESRRNLVLSLMEQHGKITSEEAQEAMNIPLSDQLVLTERESYPYEAFYNQVLAELEEMDGITINDIYNAGLKIYTTLDVSAQEQVERVLQTDEYVTVYPNNEDFTAAVTLLDTQTGQIKALGSGREDTGYQRGHNLATDERRQPGSTIKPVLDYGPAIEYLQWSTAHRIVDEAHSYSDGTPIRNFDRQFQGPMSMRTALARSRNVPAIKALQEVGVGRAQSFAGGLGIPFELQENETTMPEAYGLGGFNTGVTTKELAGAYAAFGNNGTYIEPYTVRKVEFPDGRIINMEPESTQAMSDYTAYMITDMLKTAVTNGTGGVANIPSLPMAGKTGTTNFPAEIRESRGYPDGAVPDIWFSGYTTNYTISVWTGFSRQPVDISNNYFPSGANERQAAQQIFKAIMQNVSADIETADFTMPNSVVRVAVERSTGLLPSSFTPQSEIIHELFVRGNEPTRVSDEYRELQAPTNVMASYEENTNQIIVTWDYPEDLVDDVTFEIRLAIDGGNQQTLDRKKEMQFIYGDPQPGSTYVFSIVAISDENSNLQSDPASVEVKIEEEEEPVEEEEEEEEIEEPVDEEEEETIPDPLEDVDDGNEPEEDQTTEEEEVETE
ncbi:multimodular transpeptidase-transglycosylase [Halalkalibacter wakoensis JCM 9140]|uniref:Multimodular transpeptidase-transglycosylase n=1 Tax=Halalkalibacter wakoensis JCM 9140 TaxID=1236970 RepID=W4PZC8_9BACI|nr:PBP1A family penicillin-binding protein [Halalkalibacter wakoensis]GAE25030.1 multimodular transpeptidase-transglycosylase [Halalkalibacter wakoensis JCM 9140]